MPATSRGLLVHEWIAPAGGSENVLEAMARAFPVRTCGVCGTTPPTVSPAVA